MGSSPSKLQRRDSINSNITGSDEYRATVKHKQYEFVCTTCARDKTHVNASYLCKICKDYLCCKCLQWHDKYRVDHVDDMVGLDEMRKLGVQGPPEMPTEKCVAHDDEIWNMFCPKDGFAGCRRCMEQDHRYCGSAIPRSSQHIEAVNRQMNNLSLIKESSDDKNDSHLEHYSAVGIGGKPFKEYERRDDGQVPGKKTTPLFETETLGTLQDFEKLKSIGRNRAEDQAKGSIQINKTITTDDGQVPGNWGKHHEMYSVKGYRKVYVRIPSDTKTCNIQDMCLLSDGRLLMADYENRNLKLLHPNLYISDHCDFSSGPTGICMISAKEAAVLLCINNQIEFVSLTGRIERKRSIQLEHYCEGLAYSAGELYVSDRETNIHVYTVDGRKLRTIETGIRTSNYSAYLSERLAVNKDRSRIVMSLGTYGIVCLDRLSGEVIWKTNATRDARYNGVCVDRYNNVFACRLFNSDIVQITSNGRRIGVYVHCLWGPQSICLNEARGRLIVGFLSSDIIQVFDLKIT